MYRPATFSLLRAVALAAAAALGAGPVLAATGSSSSSPAAAQEPADAPRAGAALSGASTGKAKPLATVNGVPVTRGEFDREVERLPPQYRKLAASPEGRRQILDNLILKRLLLAKARKQGLDKSTEVRAKVEAFAQQAAISALVNGVVERAGADIPDRELRSYYDSHKDEFRSAESVRASHILVETEAEAVKLREELAEGKDFEAAARAASKDPGSAARGGDLGFFAKDRMVPEFAEAAFALKKIGDLSPVVKTQFGYHVIKLTDRKPAETQPFPEVKEALEAKLLEERKQTAVNSLFKEVREGATITVDESTLVE